MTSVVLVPVAQALDIVAPGQLLPFKIVDGLGRLLLAAGQCVLDERQVAALIERGACVEKPDLESIRQSRAASATTPSQCRATLFDRWERQTWALDGLTRRLGRETGLAAALVEFADALIALVDVQVDAALYQCVRQDDRRFALYALRHALHTATVALLCTRQLGWTPERSRRAVLVALTMNSAIVELQAQMAEQTDPPTKKQMDQIRAHPSASAQLLRDSGVEDADWLDAVATHHERPDGQGYPQAITTPGDLSQVVRAADVFMAKISPRALRAPLLPQLAARQLFQESGAGPVAAALIKSLGVYPPGDFVRLRNGEAAVVVQRATAGSAVQVAAVLGANGRPVPGAPRRDTALPDCAITGPLAERDGMPRVLAEQVYGLIYA